jgi:hypothetical protein
MSKRNIYFCANHDGHAVNFYMKDDDAEFRNSYAKNDQSTHYVKVATVLKKEGGKHKSPQNGLKVFYVLCDNGKRYMVYSDYSVTEAAA